jgi:hypothetical protein
MLEEEAKEPMVAATPKASMAAAEAAEVEVEAAGAPAASAAGLCLLWLSAFSVGPYLKIRGILAAPPAILLVEAEVEEVRADQGYWADPLGPAQVAVVMLTMVLSMVLAEEEATAVLLTAVLLVG